MTYVMVEYETALPESEGFIYLRDPSEGTLHGHPVVIGDAVTEDGTPIAGEHSSQRIVWAKGITGRTPLRLDGERGLVVAGKGSG